MENTSNTRNFIAHGGSEWVIGGKLTFLPGAVVEGGEGLFEGAPEDNKAQAQIEYLSDSEAASVAQLRECFNGLLSAMRKAGFMAPAFSADPSDGTSETSE